VTHNKIFITLIIIIVCLTIALLGITLPNKTLNNEKNFSGIYQCEVDNIRATCFAIAPNLFISCCHNFGDNPNEIIFAQNEGNSVSLSVIARDTSKDLVLLKCDKQVPNYLCIDTQSIYNNKATAYGNYSGNEIIERDLTIKNQGKDCYLTTNNRQANVKILSGNIEFGFSGAPVLNSNNNLLGMISCVNKNNGDIYAISVSEINNFVEAYK